MIQLYRRELGKFNRVYIPIKIMRKIGLKKSDEVEMYLKYGRIYIKKFSNHNWKKRKFIGMIRSLDSSSRLVIPIEYTKLMGLQPNDKIKVFLQNKDTIIINKDS